MQIYSAIEESLGKRGKGGRSDTKSVVEWNSKSEVPGNWTREPLWGSCLSC